MECLKYPNAWINLLIQQRKSRNTRSICVLEYSNSAQNFEWKIFCFLEGQNNFMYEKKNKLRQPAPILDKISACLSDAVHPNINAKCDTFL